MESDNPHCQIMVINGSQELLELFREILEEFGEGRYTCTLHSLADVHHVELIREAKPHLVLVDQPFSDAEMRGWELIQKIRMARDLRDIPLIFMTTNMHLMQELEAQLISLDVRTLLKPFDPDHLLTLVRSSLGEVDGRDESEEDGEEIGEG